MTMWASATFQHLVGGLVKGTGGFAVAYVVGICIFNQTQQQRVTLAVGSGSSKGGQAGSGNRKGKGDGRSVKSGTQGRKHQIKPSLAKIKAVPDGPAPQVTKQA